MAGSKKQHYVPQLYLRHFTNESGQLSVFDKRTRRSYPSSVRDAGHENHFLTIPALDGTDGPGSYFEGHFQQIEGPASQALSALLTVARPGARARFEDDQRTVLAEYLAVQYLRTPEARARIIETQEGMTRAIVSMIGDANRLEPLHEELAEIAKIPKERHAEIHGQFVQDPQLIGEITSLLRGYIWRVMANDTGSAFYTSDHPLAFHCHVPRPGRGVGIGSYGVEIAFPISPTAMLVLVHREFAQAQVPGWEELEEVVGEATVPNVEYYRWMQIVSSRRFIFAPHDDFGLVDEVCTQDPTLCDVDRERSEILAGGRKV